MVGLKLEGKKYLSFKTLFSFYKGTRQVPFESWCRYTVLKTFIESVLDLIVLPFFRMICFWFAWFFSRRLSWEKDFFWILPLIEWVLIDGLIVFLIGWGYSSKGWRGGRVAFQYSSEILAYSLYLVIYRMKNTHFLCVFIVWR